MKCLGYFSNSICLSKTLMIISKLEGIRKDRKSLLHYFCFTHRLMIRLSLKKMRKNLHIIVDENGQTWVLSITFRLSEHTSQNYIGYCFLLDILESSSCNSL